VEADASFTSTAWILVIVVAFLNQLGSYASSDLPDWLIGALAGTIVMVIGFAVAALVINWVGQKVFKADVTFNELVRTLGLAYVWNVIGVLGVLTAFSTALACVLTPAIVIAWVAMVVAWFVAVKEALDLEWIQTIATVILGYIALFAVVIVAGLVLGLLGLTVAGIAGLFGL
jgi:hypothetical protein